MEDEPVAIYEPTADEIASMRGATASESKEVDSLILAQCSTRWRKVAMVVAKLLDVLDARFPHLPYCFVQARIQVLEDEGILDVAGDPWAMRHSEVRLHVADSEA